MLRSIATTVRALGMLRSPSSAGLADAIISTLRAGESGHSATEPLTVEAGAPRRRRRQFADRLTRSQWHRAWLRVTVPVAVILGIGLSLVNQGGMLLSGEIDLRMCAICGLDFLLPFAALNIVLAIAANIAKDRG
jgi:hypothetical protein